jgi:hypothetical protein
MMQLLSMFQNIKYCLLSIATQVDTIDNVSVVLPTFFVTNTLLNRLPNIN